MDALLVINQINRADDGEDQFRFDNPTAESAPHDVLVVINEINRKGGSSDQEGAASNCLATDDGSAGEGDCFAHDQPGTGDEFFF